VWLLASGAILLVGVWRLRAGTQPGWRAGAVLLGVLLAGHLLHYLFPPAEVDAPGAVRWAELLALPAAMLLLYRRALSWPQASPMPAPEAEAQPRRFRSPLWQLAETFLIAAVFYYGIEFTTGRFRVEGPSMQPTLTAGQFVLTDRLAYRLGQPQRGDIVVVHPDADPLAGAGHDLIKRVVGLPGEHIVVGAGVVHIDGRQYWEPYLSEPAGYNGTWTLGPDEYFVLGDNRNNSSDSHVWGPLHRDAFNSRALLVYWPPRAWTWVAGMPLAAAPVEP
jgi:signal peptidase I